jgi:hypothetical protein
MRVARRIFGSSRNEVTEYLRKFHNEKLHDLCSLPNTIILIRSRGMRWTGDVAHMGGEWSAYRILEGTPEKGVTLGNLETERATIKTDLKEIEYTGVEWIYLAQVMD